jgi:hypothetical protein
MITELTQSLIGGMSRCAYQVYLRQIKGIIIPPGIAARKGSSVHSGAEHAHRVKMETGKVAPLDEVTDATRDSFTKLITEEGVLLTPEDNENKNEVLNSSLNEAVSSVSMYHKHIVPTLDKIGMVEERLYADIGIGIPISGKPDLVADGAIRDLKTAGKRWSEGDEQKELQPDFYRLLLIKNDLPDLPFKYCKLSNLKNPPKNAGDNVTYDAEYGVCLDQRQTVRNDETANKLILRVKAVADMIKAGNFPPADPSGWICSPTWCGYYGICKYV